MSNNKTYLQIPLTIQGNTDPLPRLVDHTRPVPARGWVIFPDWPFHRSFLPSTVVGWDESSTYLKRDIGWEGGGKSPTYLARWMEGSGGAGVGAADGLHEKSSFWDLGVVWANTTVPWTVLGGTRSGLGYPLPVMTGLECPSTPSGTGYA